MMKFLLGVLLGVALTLATVAVLHETSTNDLVSSASVAHANNGTRSDKKQPLLIGASDNRDVPESKILASTTSDATHAQEDPRSRSGTELPKNQFILKAGEGIDLDAMRVTSVDEQSTADVVINEIQSGYGGHLGTRHGGATQKVPKVRSGIEITDVTPILGLLSEAPEAMSAKQARVLLKSNRSHTGLAFAMSSTGRVYRLQVLAASSEPVVVDRTIRLKVEETERRDGPLEGFDLKSERFSPASEFGRTFDDVTKTLQGKALGSATVFVARTLARHALVVDEVPAPFQLVGQQSIAFRHAPKFSVKTRAHDAIAVHADIERDTSFALNHHSTMYVSGDMHGSIQVRDHSLLVVEGDVYGKITVEWLGTVLLYGAIKGELVPQSHAKIMLAGASQPVPSMNDASHATVYLARRVQEADLAGLMPGKAQHISLHIPESDLEATTHRGLHGFKEVVVGGPIWNSLGR